MKAVAYFVAAVIALAITFFIAGCAPVQFELGREVPPPSGCVEARIRGHDC